MASAQEDLLHGAEHLRPFMESRGFAFTLGIAGTGSGGHFATGQYAKGHRTLEFSVRYGLGLVEYAIGAARIGHEDFLRYSGAWGEHAYPNFGGSTSDDFAALLRDLESHLNPFFAADSTAFKAVVAARDTAPNRFKGLAALGRSR